MENTSVVAAVVTSKAPEMSDTRHHTMEKLPRQIEESRNDLESKNISATENNGAKGKGTLLITDTTNVPTTTAAAVTEAEVERITTSASVSLLNPLRYADPARTLADSESRTNVDAFSFPPAPDTRTSIVTAEKKEFIDPYTDDCEGKSNKDQSVVHSKQSHVDEATKNPVGKGTHKVEVHVECNNEMPKVKSTVHTSQIRIVMNKESSGKDDSEEGESITRELMKAIHEESTPSSVHKGNSYQISTEEAASDTLVTEVIKKKTWNENNEPVNNLNVEDGSEQTSSGSDEDEDSMFSPSSSSSVSSTSYISSSGTSIYHSCFQEHNPENHLEADADCSMGDNSKDGNSTGGAHPTKTSIGVNLRVTGQCNQGGRKYMEDYFAVAYQQCENTKDLEYAFFGIYDGHGGAEAATFAKEHLMMAIINQKLFWSDSDQDVLRAIREGYIATHYAMWREQEKWPKTANGLPSTAGSTASIAFIRREKIYIGHVGDSAIVLGYQNENENFWRAKQLTVDHKPESPRERSRITQAGGKVVIKSGVPRVVWNRPRNSSHRGPICQETPVDEIPFLAVARSLGDLWSFNSERNEFVVSPDPDVCVVPIDIKRFRCLIFGTDGLWNVVTPQEAVNTVRYKEFLNGRLYAQKMDGKKDNQYSSTNNGSKTNEKTVEEEQTRWANPSKSLVDQALKSWSARKMRADNTSVVTVIFYPPGQGHYNQQKPQQDGKNSAEDQNPISASTMRRKRRRRKADVALQASSDKSTALLYGKKILQERIMDHYPKVNENDNGECNNLNRTEGSSHDEKGEIDVDQDEDEYIEEDADGNDDNENCAKNVEDKEQNIDIGITDDEVLMVNYDDNISYQDMAIKYIPPEEYRHFHYCATKSDAYGYANPPNVTQSHTSIRDNSEKDIVATDFTVLTDGRQIYEYNARHLQNQQHVQEYYQYNHQQMPINRNSMSVSKEHLLIEPSYIQREDEQFEVHQHHHQQQLHHQQQQQKLNHEEVIGSVMLDNSHIPLMLTSEHYNMDMSHINWTGNASHQTWTPDEMFSPVIVNDNRETNEGSNLEKCQVQRSILTIDGQEQSDGEDCTDYGNEKTVCVINYKDYLPQSGENLAGNTLDISESHTSSNSSWCSTSINASVNLNDPETSATETNSQTNTSYAASISKSDMQEILKEQQLYQEQCMNEEEGYCLTKLETRREQQNCRVEDSTTTTMTTIETMKILKHRHSNDHQLDDQQHQQQQSFSEIAVEAEQSPMIISTAEQIPHIYPHSHELFERSDSDGQGSFYNVVQSPAEVISVPHSLQHIQRQQLITTTTTTTTTLDSAQSPITHHCIPQAQVTTTTNTSAGIVTSSSSSSPTPYPHLLPLPLQQKPLELHSLLQQEREEEQQVAYEREQQQQQQQQQHRHHQHQWQCQQLHKHPEQPEHLMDRIKSRPIDQYYSQLQHQHHDEVAIACLQAIRHDVVEILPESGLNHLLNNNDATEDDHVDSDLILKSTTIIGNDEDNDDGDDDENDDDDDYFDDRIEHKKQHSGSDDCVESSKIRSSGDKCIRCLSDHISSICYSDESLQALANEVIIREEIYNPPNTTLSRSSLPTMQSLSLPMHLSKASMKSISNSQCTTNARVLPTSLRSERSAEHQKNLLSWRSDDKNAIRSTASKVIEATEEEEEEEEREEEDTQNIPDTVDEEQPTEADRTTTTTVVMLLTTTVSGLVNGRGSGGAEVMLVERETRTRSKPQSIACEVKPNASNKLLLPVNSKRQSYSVNKAGEESDSYEQSFERSKRISLKRISSRARLNDNSSKNVPKENIELAPMVQENNMANIVSNCSREMKGKARLMPADISDSSIYKRQLRSCKMMKTYDSTVNDEMTPPTATDLLPLRAESMTAATTIGASNKIDYFKRTLRSRNSLGKDLKSKTALVLPAALKYPNNTATKKFLHNAVTNIKGEKPCSNDHTTTITTTAATQSSFSVAPAITSASPLSALTRLTATLSHSPMMPSTSVSLPPPSIPSSILSLRSGGGGALKRSAPPKSYPNGKSPITNKKNKIEMSNVSLNLRSRQVPPINVVLSNGSISSSSSSSNNNGSSISSNSRISNNAKGGTTMNNNSINNKQRSTTVGITTRVTTTTKIGSRTTTANERGGNGNVNNLVNKHVGFNERRPTMQRIHTRSSTSARSSTHSGLQSTLVGNFSKSTRSQSGGTNLAAPPPSPKHMNNPAAATAAATRARSLLTTRHVVVKAAVTAGTPVPTVTMASTAATKANRIIANNCKAAAAATTSNGNNNNNNYHSQRCGGTNNRSGKCAKCGSRVQLVDRLEKRDIVANDMVAGTTCTRARNNGAFRKRTSTRRKNLAAAMLLSHTDDLMTMTSSSSSARSGNTGNACSLGRRVQKTTKAVSMKANRTTVPVSASAVNVPSKSLRGRIIKRKNR